MKKVLLSLLILGLSVAYAGTTYHVNLYRPTLVNGIQLKAGECKVEVHDNKITFKQGKVSAEATVKVENNADKFASTTSAMPVREAETNCRKFVSVGPPPSSCSSTATLGQ